MTFKAVTLSWGMLVVAVLLNGLGLYVVKAKLNALGAVPVGTITALTDYCVSFARSPTALFGVLCILAAPLPHAIALSRMPLGIAYPASVALTCLVVIPLSIITLGEPLGAPRVAGAALLLVSLVLLFR
jgi:multidrug transporter EmrE-like cation transporter